VGHNIILNVYMVNQMSHRLRDVVSHTYPLCLRADGLHTIFSMKGTAAPILIVPPDQRIKRFNLSI
jgi:hypothetical protein